MTLYAWPRVGRAGLGNSLFAWARAELFARRTGAHVLAPHWPNVRIGPYLRREPEKRSYRNFFRSTQHVRGISRTLALALGQRISETESGVASLCATPTRPCVVEFHGMGDLFAPLAGEHEFVRERLWEMTVPDLRVNAGEMGFVAMHVRRGDLTRQGIAEHKLGSRLPQYTPLSWFAAMAEVVRRVERLRDLPIMVFTDGSPDEIVTLLAIDGVRLAPRRPAIADLWLLSHARLLFASGYSTFSMWASFLGGMPTVYAPGKIQQSVQIGRPAPAEIELEDGAELAARIEGLVGPTKPSVAPPAAQATGR